MTHTEAAKKAGMPVQQWSDYLNGRKGGTQGISLAVLDRIAKALGVKARDLLK